MTYLKLRFFEFVKILGEYSYDAFVDVHYYFRNLFRKLGRMIYWGWHLRNSVDFSADTLYYVMYLKLSRVYKCMLSDSHLVWNSDKDTVGMRKLREATELCRRLSQEQPENGPVERFLNKYRTERPSWGDESFPKDRKVLPNNLYRFFFKKARERETKELQGMKQRLYFLLDRHLDSWWD